ncbi:MAG: hypothetical protein ACKVQJ_14140 [Pyrinomonadaceae bacterium]
MRQAIDSFPRLTPAHSKVEKTRKVSQQIIVVSTKKQAKDEYGFLSVGTIKTAAGVQKTGPSWKLVG